MSNITEYPVFEADQVLKSDHLNNMFNYLDDQDRLTRRYLIGIGIVCGLDSYYDKETITITKGVGVTSRGYLIQFDGGNYTQARPYTLPDDTHPDELALYGKLKMWKLFKPTTENPLAAGDTALTNSSFLQDKVVILFLEWRIVDMKNCTTNDCDDKGKEAQFTIQPLLVLKQDLATFKYAGFETAKANLPDIVLRRYNVPFKPLKSPTDILNSFYNITDVTTLKSIADAYSNAYNAFKPILPGESSNPFTNLFTSLSTQLTTVKNSTPVFTQYFYDLLDDLIKAYLEFREKGNALLIECCPDQDLFPFHLALSEALTDSRTNVSAYRNYFIHSPVFGTQKALAGEVQMLFSRMKLLMGHFILPDTKSIPDAPIKITPSQYGRSYLSERAVPYYYNPSTLLNYWSPEKTKSGKASKNLSYNSNKYSTDDKVVNPLKYELEPYNFFRVEGHIGKKLEAALANIVKQKQNFSLPFDVIALNVDAAGNMRPQDVGKCHFGDLESLYNVLLAELLCKLHEPVCFLSRLPYINLQQSTIGVFNSDFKVNDGIKPGANTPGAGAGEGGANTPFNISALNAAGISSINELQNLVKSTTKRAVLNINVGALYAANQTFVDQARNISPYHKGTVLKHFCNPGTAAAGKPKTVGQVYLETIKNNATGFPKPANIDTTGGVNFNTLLNYVYQHIFYFIDTTEEVYATLLPHNLYALNFPAFAYKYKLLVEEAEAFAKLLLSLLAFYEVQQGEKPETRLEDFVEEVLIDLVIDEMEMITHLCMDDRIEQLYDEYLKRVKQLNLERMFAQYTTRHSGIDHKAGVPRGGTFILVYEERPRTATGFTRGTVLVQAEDAVEISENVGDAPQASAAKASGASDAQSTQFNDAVRAFELNKAKLTEAEYMSALLLIEKIKPAGTQIVDTFNIADGIVFADFYLPYMCCSDCAPISYIITGEPVPPTESPTIKLSKNLFCSNDTEPLTITVSPKGGKLNFDKASQENDTTYHVAVADLPAGDTTFTYTLNAESASDKVTVFAAPDAAFTTEQIPSKPGAVSFFSVATDASLVHEWDFDDPNSGTANTSTLANPVHEYKSIDGASGSFNVKHTVTSKEGCKTTVTQKVDVSNIQPTTIALSKKTFCSNDQDPLTITVGPSGGTLSLAAATKINDTTYQVAVKDLPVGDTTITYTANGQPAADKVTVSAAPDAGFSSVPDPAKQGTIKFTSKATNTFDKHEWTFGDSASGAANTSTEFNPTHSYQFAGASKNFDVTHKVTAQNGCVSTVVNTITVQGTPTTISLSKKTFCSNDTDPLTITVGPAGGTLSFAAAQKVNDTTYQVAIKDLPVGDTNISYTANGQAASDKVTVFAAPDAGFSNSPIPSKPGAVQFTSKATDASDKHEWNFGDPNSGTGNTSTIANPVHEYKNIDGASASFNVLHTVTTKDGCKTSVTQKVDVTNVQPATISLSKKTFCSNDTEPLTITVSPAGGKLSFAAAKQINNTTFQVEVKDLPPGDTNISYTANGQTASDKVTLSDAPDAGFSNSAIPSKPGSVQFKSNSTDTSDKHEWNFGDPTTGANNTSKDVNPVHEYQFTGVSKNFDVAHTITGKNGCVSKIVNTITVRRNQG